MNPPEKHKYQHWTGAKPSGDYEKWLAKAKEKPGSWWPDWQAWISRQNKEKVPARAPGGGKYRPIEDAPGTYVRKQS